MVFLIFLFCQWSLHYCSHSSPTLAAGLCKNMIQV